MDVNTANQNITSTQIEVAMTFGHDRYIRTGSTHNGGLASESDWEEAGSDLAGTRPTETTAAHFCVVELFDGLGIMCGGKISYFKQVNNLREKMKFAYWLTVR
jgi:hypothetical protein